MPVDQGRFHDLADYDQRMPRFYERCLDPKGSNKDARALFAIAQATAEEQRLNDILAPFLNRWTNESVNTFGPVAIW